MSLDPVRIGLVGAGRIAQMRHLPAYQKHDGVLVVAAADPSREALERAAADFAIPTDLCRLP